MFIEIDENGYATGAWSVSDQPTWKTFFVSEVPENLSYYKVVDGVLVFQEDRKEKLLKAETNSQVIQDLRQYLDDTDWLVVRFMETGKAIPDGISEQRQKARDEISLLEQDM